MTEVDAPAKLHTLLSADGRELVNIKFFPGTDRGLTPSQLAEEAARVIELALAKGANIPPSTGAEQSTLEAFMASR